MRILELLFLISILAFWGSYFYKKDWTKLILGATVLFLLMHLLIEGIRWQMSPAYFAFLISGMAFFFDPKKKWLSVVISFFSVFFLLIGGALAYLMPVIKFPELTGNYQVGVTSLYLEDAARSEDITTDDGNDLRRISLKIWYPSEKIVTNPERYMSDGIAEAFAVSKGIPPFAVSHFELTPTHSEKDLPIIEKSLPTIVLSHGYLWNVELYTSIVEELASQGFLVVGIQHTYEAPLVNWKDQQYYPIQEYFIKANTIMDFDKYNALENQFKTAKNDIEEKQAMKDLMHMLPYTESVERWRNDISFVIDYLSESNQQSDHFFYQKIDTSKIGLVGHSFGGGAVGETCAFDERVKAGINMDGAQWGILIDTTITIPFMAMYADRNYEEFFTPNFYIYEQSTIKDFYEVRINNSGHANYGDLGYWTLLHKFTETGSINPDKMSAYTSTLIQDFFEKYMIDNSIDIIKRQEGNTGVTIQKLK